MSTDDYSQRCLKTEIGVRDVVGSLNAEGLGTIQFTVRDDDGVDHRITLQNTILLPSAQKNLSSITRWSRDLQDDCAVLSRREQSVFMWGHDKFRKTAQYPPDCSIPLMAVNDSDAAALRTNTQRKTLRRTVREVQADGFGRVFKSA